MIGHLDLQPGLQHLAHQRRQQPVVAGQLDALGAGPVDQLVAQSRIAGSSPTNGNATRRRHLGPGSAGPRRGYNS